MVNTVTFEEIRRGLESDNEWLRQGEEVQQILAPFVAKLPELMAHMLPNAVNLKQVLEAKMIFIRYCLENNVVQKLAEYFGAGRVGMMAEALGYALEHWGELLKNIDHTLRSQGLSERDVLIKCGLRGSALQMYDRQTLTFADLLRMQPMVILQNA